MVHPRVPRQTVVEVDREESREDRSCALRAGPPRRERFFINRHGDVLHAHMFMFPQRLYRSEGIRLGRQLARRPVRSLLVEQRHASCPLPDYGCGPNNSASLTTSGGSAAEGDHVIDPWQVSGNSDAAVQRSMVRASSFTSHTSPTPYVRYAGRSR